MACRAPLLATLLLVACGSGSAPGPASSGGSGGGPASSGGSGGAGSSARVPVATRQMDLLFLIDNSLTMGTKQELLAESLPELLARLANPICIDAAGAPQPAPQPGQDCAEGQRRQFDAVTDLHVGFISSSLADGGANLACPAQGFPRHRPDLADMAHLIGSRTRGQGLGANAHGFLEWQAGGNFDALSSAARQLLRAVDDAGCGWEASLESWYRFLVDPEPYRSLVREACPGGDPTALSCVGLERVEGRVAVDETLLAQRSAFLRPGSLLSIVILSDENDCSFRVGPREWLHWSIEDQRPLPRAAALCDTDPNHQCCYSCGSAPPQGCEPDPVCGDQPATNPVRLTPAEDGTNLRCVDPLRRFGVDALYPVERYQNALTQRTLCKSAPDLAAAGCPAADLVDNPLFAGGRDPASVLLTAIVGVPWQSLASQRDGAQGPLGADALRFKSAAELDALGTWDQILGSPGERWRPAAEGRPERASVPPVPPLLPQMLESALPRPGITPGNELNGREYDTLSLLDNPPRPQDLQYACIFPLPTPIDCLARDRDAGEPCGCYEGENDRPICEQQPGTSTATTNQWWGQAYPGLRHIELLKRYGENAVLGSICARSSAQPSAADFGYKPAFSALYERLQALNAP